MRPRLLQRPDRVHILERPPVWFPLKAHDPGVPGMPPLYRAQTEGGPRTADAGVYPLEEIPAVEPRLPRRFVRHRLPKPYILL